MTRYYLAAGVLIVMVFGYTKVRGIRNNNPGNLKKTGDQWVGLRSIQTDKTFFQFTHVKYGIRAMAKVLINYQLKHGLDTLEEIIGRWAPTSENDTGSYILSVANKMSIDPDDRFSVEQYIEPLIKAIITHENGINPYSDATIKEGVSLV